MDIAQKKVVTLFHNTYRNCRAYKDFIDKHKFDPSKVKTIEDFRQVPIMDKHDYIKKYPIEHRFHKNRQLSDFYMICSSSGTTGEPILWPRDYNIDLTLEKAKENLFEEHFQISKKKTLCLITFGLGPWTAGMLSARLSWPAAKNNRFSVATPGLDKNNTISLLTKLYPYYEQVILLGYPPFLTDVIETARKQKVDLKRANLKLLYTSERVSENWRNQMAKLISPQHDRHDFVGFYASADTGITGSETKFSINLLGEADQNTALCQALFGSNTPPTLVAFNAKYKFLESVNGEILITADQPVPLIRYNIHDRGNLLPKNELKTILQNFKIDYLDKDLSDNYVYVFGRSDSVKVTANIYVEDINYCLENSSFKNKLSGNFKYGTEKSRGLRYRLKILVYLKPGKQLTYKQKSKFEKEFYQRLLESNNDFKMIQSGTKIEKFKFEYLQDDPTKYQSGKLKYFL